MSPPVWCCRLFDVATLAGRVIMESWWLIVSAGRSGIELGGGLWLWHRGGIDSGEECTLSPNISRSTFSFSRMLVSRAHNRTLVVIVQIDFRHDCLRRVTQRDGCSLPIVGMLSSSLMRSLVVCAHFLTGPWWFLRGVSVKCYIVDEVQLCFIDDCDNMSWDAVMPMIRNWASVRRGELTFWVSRPKKLAIWLIHGTWYMVDWSIAGW